MTTQPTIDRINALRKHLGEGIVQRRPLLVEELHDFVGGTHEIINDLDEAAGIDTRWAKDCSKSYPFGPSAVKRQVGARLALLERHVGALDSPPYFWLGQEAEVCQPV